MRKLKEFQIEKSAVSVLNILLVRIKRILITFVTENIRFTETAYLEPTRLMLNLRILYMWTVAVVQH
jgi:hypothetical protein